MKSQLESGGLVIRNFRIGDYPAVIELWRAAGLPLKTGGRDSLENIGKQIRQRSVIFLVASHLDRIVGTVLATHDGRKGWLNRLAVAQDYRRAGIGRKLVFEAESRFKALGLGIFAALIEDWNTDSMDVFERLGYKKHPEILYFAKRTFPGV
jgi:ribosomal protein S18 acetylase RimI-like enzyme